ncbi:MAG: IspD/TarI family cytidylyltransferase [Candidatus Brocadiia bacterium]
MSLKTIAIVAAAGSGERLGYGIPKAFVSLGERTILECCMAGIHRQGVDHAIVALPIGMAANTTLTSASPNCAILETLVHGKPQAQGTFRVEIPSGMAVSFVTGGTRRQDSVRNCAAMIPPEAGVILIHDAARPFLRDGLAADLAEAAMRWGAAAPALPCADTLKVGREGKIINTVDRRSLFGVQTPQAFRRDIFLKMLSLYSDADVTDDCAIAETIGTHPHIVSGSPFTFKITTAADLELARLLAASRGYQ